MTKKHIITFCYRKYAVDSITAATQAMALLSKLVRVKHVTDGDYKSWHYTPHEDEDDKEISMELNQNYRDRAKAKPAKTLALPSPKRGTILCICEKSYVAPRETCVSCGRPFSDSHNRVHSDRSATPNLRLL